MSSAAQSLPVPNLRAWREAKYLAARELAEAVGVSRYSILRWERGTHAPSFPAVRRLAAALSITPDQLVHECPPVPSNTRGAA